MIANTNNPTVHPRIFKWLQSLGKAQISVLWLIGLGNPLNSTFCVVYQCLKIMWMHGREERHCTHIFLSYCNRWHMAELGRFGRYSRKGAKLGLIRTLSLHYSTLKKGGCGLHPHNFNPLKSLNKRRIKLSASRARVRVWEANASPTLHLHVPELVRTTRPRPLSLALCGQRAETVNLTTKIERRAEP